MSDKYGGRYIIGVLVFGFHRFQGPRLLSLASASALVRHIEPKVLQGPWSHLLESGEQYSQESARQQANRCVQGWPLLKRNKP